MLYSVISTEHYPNVKAVAKQLSAGDPAREQQLMMYAKSCVESAYDYFKEKFDNELKAPLVAYKAARYFSPTKLNELKPSATDIDSLRAFTLLDSTLIIDGLKAELPMYLAASADVSTQTDAIAWWKSHETELPNWANACRLIFLIQPYHHQHPLNEFFLF